MLRVCPGARAAGKAASKGHKTAALCKCSSCKMELIKLEVQIPSTQDLPGSLGSIGINWHASIGAVTVACAPAAQG
jgi:hypothetical protein